MAAKKIQIPKSSIKASESVVAGMLASMLGVRSCQLVEAVCEMFVDAMPDGGLSDLISSVEGMYAWQTDVAREIMSDDPGELVEHLVFASGRVLVAKDTMRSGKESLWLVVADPPRDFLRGMQGTTARGLIHNFKIGDTITQVIGLQLSSCLP